MIAVFLFLEEGYFKVTPPGEDHLPPDRFKNPLRTLLKPELNPSKSISSTLKDRL